MHTVTSVLFVCAGNICRSPTAEVLCRRLVASEPALANMTVGSAGTIAMDGNLPSADSVDALRDGRNLELATHRARRLSRRDTADLILALDRETEQEAKAICRGRRVEMLGDFAGTGEEVADPYGWPRQRHDDALEHIERLVTFAVARLVSDAAAASGS